MNSEGVIQVLMGRDDYHRLVSLVCRAQSEWEEKLSDALRYDKDVSYCEAQLRALDNLMRALKIGSK